MRKIILASGSPRRKMLLKKLKIDFETEVSDFEEKLEPGLSPFELTKFFSQEKAKSVAKKHKDTLVIGADTLISIKGKILGKPRDKKEAEKMLEQLNGQEHSVITSYTIIDTKTKKMISKSVETKVYFKNLTDKEIKDYIKSGEPLGKAGAYAIQGLGKALVKKTIGDYSNIVGLPLKSLSESLKEFGLSVEFKNEN